MACTDIGYNKNGSDNYEKKTKGDFEKDLGVQIHLLRKRCADSDEGGFLEAKQISVILRNFLHGTDYTTSIS